jgi:hypothetical protein
LRPRALEFLDNIHDNDFKHVIELVEQVFESDGAEDSADPVEFISLEAVIETLATGSDPWLKTLAVYFRERLNPAAPDVQCELPRRSAG